MGTGTEGRCRSRRCGIRIGRGSGGRGGLGWRGGGGWCWGRGICCICLVCGEFIFFLDWVGLGWGWGEGGVLVGGKGSADGEQVSQGFAGLWEGGGLCGGELLVCFFPPLSVTFFWGVR